MAPSTTLRRLLKEVSELSSTTANPNPTFYAAPVSDSDLHEWHFTLLGPPSPSPYAGGLYHGRISLPPQYPYKPPNFRFLTPSGRFEVNREICLSISGFHEETWMPAWGVRTALVALRSFMSEAGTAGQVGGLESNEEVRKRLAKESRNSRCGECCKTNEEIMNEWWDICREAGVEVDEEGMSLEAVPEGMNLKAKSKGKEKEVSKDDEQDKEMLSQTTSTSADDLIKPQSETNTKPMQQPSDSPVTSAALSPSSPIQSQSQPQASVTAPHTKPTPTSPALQQTPPLPQRQPQQLYQSQPVPQAQPQTQNEVITLDRAITAVFLALCVMILKKIFYPAGTAFGADELGMVKEY